MESLILFLVFAGLILWGVGSVVLNDSNKSKLKQRYDKHFSGINKVLNAEDIGDGMDASGMAESEPVARRLQQLEEQLQAFRVQSEKDRRRIETLEKLVTDSGDQTGQVIRHI
ncbi:hypothetical protein SAMN04488540_102341 [Ferrimonas sediminum]|uniref:Uncharacterized protein n=1 Tax=Ferrimonas sediminum TaxID=718193 RepID=A0A1G8MCM3_9GAMM|nr:hypothetical protein [Ferrimonas sediminum]SDI65693.1 hypothetical protein SAMN04488540_102341 [Ferrimonas sediminum]